MVLNLSIKLEELLFAIQSSNMELKFFYSKIEERLICVFDGLVDGAENSELIEEIEYSDDYILVPNKYDVDEYSMMERFIYTIPSELIQSRLEESIHGKGAFRRFKDAIFNLGINEEWYKFRDECYKEFAKEWCDDYHVTFIE